jgi:hypothetical protein
MPIDSGYGGTRGRRDTLTPRAEDATGRRPTPPEATGAEANYFVEQIAYVHKE